MFTATIFVIAENWKQPRCASTQKWMKKIWFIYTMEYYSGIKNKDIMNFTGKWMKVENVILREVTQSQKNTYGMYSLISVY